MTILAVEGVERDLNSIRLTLGMEGLRVRTASTGEDALENIAKCGMPLLLIVDIFLGPGMDGVSLFKAVRSLDADIPVIFATGRPDLLIDSPVKFDLRTKLLLKPYSEEALIADIRQMIIYKKPQRRLHNGGPSFDAMH